MLREMFVGKLPSQFEINTIIKAYITAEMLLWSAWNFITPIFAIFVIQIPGGTVDVAASSYSVYLLVRVIFELISGKYLIHKSIAYKFLITVLGLSIISLAYFGLAFSTLIWELYLFYGMVGLGIGLASPAKNTLFSSHLDKRKDAMQWGVMDAAVFLAMSLSAVVGGFIARVYGFQTLFIVAGILNIVSVLPYLVYIKKWRQTLATPALS